MKDLETVAFVDLHLVAECIFMPRRLANQAVVGSRGEPCLFEHDFRLQLVGVSLLDFLVHEVCDHRQVQPVLFVCGSFDCAAHVFFLLREEMTFGAVLR